VWIFFKFDLKWRIQLWNDFVIVPSSFLRMNAPDRYGCISFFFSIISLIFSGHFTKNFRKRNPSQASILKFSESYHNIWDPIWVLEKTSKLVRENSPELEKSAETRKSLNLVSLISIDSKMFLCVSAWFLIEPMTMLSIENRPGFATSSFSKNSASLTSFLWLLIHGKRIIC